MGHVVRNAAWQILAVLIFALFIGFIFGKPFIAVLIALLFILASFLRNLFRLVRWLESDIDTEVPGASGAWVSGPEDLQTDKSKNDYFWGYI